ncbi:type II toxin-antitoxin system RelE/ParE family toxin [Aeromonas hydrophila]|uniref:type II toxin-antitoxin system RelE/ParE family toxin n=1 Tax=Aeromonas hydrophila TaxID=644 RepID=UPI000C75A7B8|nr:type II toxin-antitoxin system RelE/ParE family toxin [Aeromonas hydrophila]AWA05056.1 type II toxin-antitoxin system RelE/ParE family toxin [Aeromonas hydrophila subsp. hydrophila]
MFNVSITQTAIECALDIEAFNTPKLGQDKAQALAESLLDNAEEHLSENPMRFRVCPLLASFGVVIRERIDDRRYRTLFSVDEVKGSVEVLLILHERQDIQGALTRHLLSYKLE